MAVLVTALREQTATVVALIRLLLQVRPHVLHRIAELSEDAATLGTGQRLSLPLGLTTPFNSLVQVV